MKHAITLSLLFVASLASPIKSVAQRASIADMGALTLYNDSLSQRLYALQMRLDSTIKRVDSIINKGVEQLVADSVVRPLNTGFQVSATRPSRVSYTMSIACSVVTGSTSGSVSVETSADAVKWVNPSTFGNSWSAVLGLGTHTVTNTVVKFVPAGHWVRIRTTSTGSGTIITYLKGQETTQ